ncbi:N-acetyl-gamma-glutamyl-phosphate reductase [Oceanithermus sp.]|uniref:N-acetyl-gamma-glutamyl-phosphate reductase n=1 Tax=Oceanithermus sp. TaxID=2268145 RepID=UPI0025F1B666|nr:N-acetyl-gamma-glutamyl-phosphate reductase [Oceanithermus sp.]
MVRVAILGASGYGGSELIRILGRHPEVELVGFSSRAYAGRPLSAAWPQIDLSTPFAEVEEAVAEAELVFVALPNGIAMELAPRLIAEGRRVVDLSGDFRLPPAVYEAWYGIRHAHPDVYPRARYGLTELFRDDLAGAELVANPGCYVTAASLALAPLTAEGLDEVVTIAAMSGVSGAGRDAGGTAFAEVNENLRPYKPAGSHRHTAEIEFNLGRVRAQGRRVRTHGPAEPRPLSFTPHLVPMTRGILTTAYVTPARPLRQAELDELYRVFYEGERFVRLTEDLPQTKGVYGANTVWIRPHLDERTGQVVVFAAIDNLVKGASGQAVQNMNVVYGFDEGLGLETHGLWP